MILKGSQRSGAKQLAKHLLRGEENEHVELHEVRGFASDKPDQAFKEMEAISKGTRCTQFMFSLSLNPPGNANVPVEAFEKAIEAVEKKLGLDNQPRIVVFHEKEGRRHAHCVWSRIDAEKMKAISMSHYPLKLRDLSKQLFLEHGWHLPRGYVDSKERNPLNFTLDEWQQAKRLGDDPKTIKATLQECWGMSDNKQAFTKALEERGFYLAQGDRRGFVAVDYRGEVYSLSRMTGVKTKELEHRLGDNQALPTVDQIKQELSQRMTQSLHDHAKAVLDHARQKAAPLIQERLAMTKRHKDHRQRLDAFQAKREQQETQARAARLGKGVKGIWQRITGQYQRTREQNEREAHTCRTRDREQRQFLIEEQMKERRALQQQILAIRQREQQERQILREHIAHYMRVSQSASKQASIKTTFQSRSQEQNRSQTKDRGRSPE